MLVWVCLWLAQDSVTPRWQQRGFVELRGNAFPQTVPGDSGRLTGEGLWRQEVSLALGRGWKAFGAMDARTDSRNQTARTFVWSATDRTIQRPAFALRRASLQYQRRWLTVEAGRQFIRWGKADLLNPTDRFAPRDFMSVVTNDFLGVTAIRATVERGANTVDAVWAPVFTPSRIPLLNQRWVVAPPVPFAIADLGARYPEGQQFGIRFNHVGRGYEASAMAYDGFNHLPLIEGALTPQALGIRRYHPHLRLYGGDAAVPLPWFTLKAEGAWFTSRTRQFDEFAQVVVQLERMSGEWIFVGGYAGEVVTQRRNVFDFAPDRGLARSFLGRAGYTIDANRSFAFEGAVRQNGNGAFGKFEYTQARGAHWRWSGGFVLIRGEAADFLGQYRRNSHAFFTLRYSY